MAEPSTIGQATQQLVSDLFNTNIWNCTRYLLDKGNMNEHIAKNILSLSKVGFAIGFFVSIVQILADLVTQTYANGVHPLRSIQKTLIKIVFMAILLTPSVYQFLCIKAIATPCNSMAEAITVNYSDNFQEKFSKTFDVIGDASGKKQSIFTSAFWEQLTTGFVAVCIYIVALAFTFIMPILQSILFLFAFYLGPICIPFMVCDLTSSISKGWLSLILTSAFMSVIGSLSFMVADTANVMSRMQAGAGWENVLIISVYGIISIILFASSFPIAAALFNASGAFSSAMSPTNAIRSSVKPASLAGAIGAGAGGALLKGGAKLAASSGNEKLSKTLTSMGDKMLQGANTLSGRKSSNPSAKSTQDAKSGDYTPNM